LKLLDLFSGIGGFSLGLERAGFQTVAFCEIEPRPRKTLAKHWPGVPIYDDIKTLTAGQLAADGVAVDAICGGFPCQDVSGAGNRAGLAGERSGLWRHQARLIGEIRPAVAFVENVTGLLSLGMGEVLGDLAALGYDAEWHCIPASAVGATQCRDRVWLVAYPNGKRGRGGETWGQYAKDAWQPSSNSWGRDWDIEPRVGRVAHGVPGRAHRLKALGNSIVPHIPELIGRAVLKAGI
jgi:DNA (cytosine-5)-methyltransferase 1